MAQATQNQDDDRSESDDDGAEAQAAPAPGKSAANVLPYRGSAPKGVPAPGFFAIYKKGQGYWTRMLTAIGACILIGLTAQFLWEHLPTMPFWGTLARPAIMNITAGIVAGFLVAIAALAYRMMNKAGNVDFLVATDSEMKKVNWASRAELIGSTKVVIFFMFLMATVLFVIDWFFHMLFYVLTVLRTAPPFFPRIHG